MLSSEMGTIHWDEIPMLPKEDATLEYLDWFFLFHSAFSDADLPLQYGAWAFSTQYNIT